MKNNSLLATALTGLFVLGVISAASAEPIGSAVRVVNKVTGSLDQQQRDLKAGDGVSQNEAIEVATDSLGELKLKDDTKLALGPGSRLVLDKFVYDPKPSTGSVTVNLTKGAFRFITGLSRKQNYELRTPSASITVRGTVFDVYVDAAGGTWLLLLEGSVRVCNTSNQCANVTDPCGVVHINATGGLDGPVGWPAQAQRIDFATAFPFVVAPPSIDATPLFTRTAVEQNQCAKPKSQRAEASPPPPERYESPQPQAPYTPVAAPKPVLPRNFAGGYVGINVGYGFSTSDTDVGCVSPAGAFSFSPNCYQAIVGGAFVTSYDPSPKGVLGGVQAGYNFRFTNVVLGVVSDIAGGSISGDSSSATALPTFVPEFATVEEKIDWLGTVRGRLGFVTDNLLIYATAGLAYGQVKTSYDLNLPGVLIASGSSSGWQAGWTVGGGGELSFGMFTINAEYLYFDLGSRDVAPSPVVFGVLQPATNFPTSFDANGHLFRIGTNFPLN